MQSKRLERNIPISPAPIDVTQIKVLTDNLHYSLQRRLENVIAFGQEALELLMKNSPEDARSLENYMVLLEDSARLAKNDLMLLDCLQPLLQKENKG